MHGGTITARSEGEGQGSEFVVRLPELTQTPETPNEPTASESPATTSRRILVVDDNRDAAKTMAMLLKITGNEIRIAYDGLEALETANQFQPDIILLDIGLPKLNGYEVASKIRDESWGKNMIIVALTGWGQPDDRGRSAEIGFNAHMVKPVDYDELVKLLAGFE